MKLPEYKSLAEKDAFFAKRITVDYKDELDALLLELANSRDTIIYRGVSEAKYRIYTSMQRVWLTKDLCKNTSFERIVYSMLQGLRNDKTVIGYLKSMDVPYNDLLGLAMLQHYGAPTVLLDFTLDLNTALFFALDGMNENNTELEVGDYISLYVMVRNPNWHPCDVVEVLRSGMDKGVQMVTEHNRCGGISIDTSLLENIDEYTMYANPSNPGGGINNYPIAYLGNPLSEPSLTTYKKNQKLVWSNLNLIAQKGCFVLYNEQTNPLEEYCKEKCIQLNCYDIHKSLASYIKKKIALTRDDIYPDLNQRVIKTYKTFLENL